MVKVDKYEKYFIQQHGTCWYTIDHPQNNCFKEK